MVTGRRWLAFENGSHWTHQRQVAQDLGARSRARRVVAGRQAARVPVPPRGKRGVGACRSAVRPSIRSCCGCSRRWGGRSSAHRKTISLVELLVVFLVPPPVRASTCAPASAAVARQYGPSAHRHWWTLGDRPREDECLPIRGPSRPATSSPDVTHQSPCPSMPTIQIPRFVLNARQYHQGENVGSSPFRTSRRKPLPSAPKPRSPQPCTHPGGRGTRSCCRRARWPLALAAGWGTAERDPSRLRRGCTCTSCRRGC